MSDTTRSIRWRSEDGATIEHCVVKIGASSIAAEGLMLAGTEPDEFGMRYRIVVDAEWAGIRSLHVTKLGGATVALRHDGYGEWTDGEGKKRPDLSKCLDVVVDGSRFPISVTARRLAWKANKTVELPVIRVALPTLEVSATTLKVTAIEPGKSYRAAVGGEEATEYLLDADGLSIPTLPPVDVEAGTPSDEEARAASVST